jgi:hypothetical protein
LQAYPQDYLLYFFFAILLSEPLILFESFSACFIYFSRFFAFFHFYLDFLGFFHHFY